jgi:hypothetical protein
MSHGLPIDRSYEFDREDWPATPQAYKPLDHFVQRYHEPERFLDKSLDGIEAIRRTITHGELRDNGDGCACFVLTWYGVQYYVITGFHEKGYKVVVTGWPVNRDRNEAIESGRWTEEEIETIDEMNNKHFDDPVSVEYEEYIEWSKNNPDGGLIADD